MFFRTDSNFFPSPHPVFIPLVLPLGPLLAPVTSKQAGLVHDLRLHSCFPAVLCPEAGVSQAS